MVIIAINETFFKSWGHGSWSLRSPWCVTFLSSVVAGYCVLFVYGRMSVRYGMYESDGVHNPSPTAERLNPVSLSINQQSYCVSPFNG